MVLASTVIPTSDSHGTHDLIFLCDCSWNPRIALSVLVLGPHLVDNTVSYDIFYCCCGLCLATDHVILTCLPAVA
jgi:hypothetical protein